MKLAARKLATSRRRNSNNKCWWKLFALFCVFYRARLDHTCFLCLWNVFELLESKSMLGLNASAVCSHVHNCGVKASGNSHGVTKQLFNFASAFLSNCGSIRSCSLCLTFMRLTVSPVSPSYPRTVGYWLFLPSHYLNRSLVPLIFMYFFSLIWICLSYCNYVGYRDIQRYH